MRALLDTHALLWWLSDDPALSKPARKFIAETKNTAIVSAASAWEIATKVRLGKLPTAADLAADFVSYLEREGFELLSISAEHAIRAGLLAGTHKDPFDRISRRYPCRQQRTGLRRLRCPPHLVTPWVVPLLCPFYRLLSSWFNLLVPHNGQDLLCHGAPLHIPRAFEMNVECVLDIAWLRFRRERNLHKFSWLVAGSSYLEIINLVVILDESEMAREAFKITSHDIN